MKLVLSQVGIRLNGKGMNLIIFDIDGTLTETTEMDSRCFMRTLEDILRIKEINTDWESYKHSTDSGVLLEIYDHHFHKMPTAEEILTIQNCFVNYLQQEWSQNKNLCSCITGASSLFSLIEELAQWHIAIATGGWKPSALFKLDAAKIPHHSVPKAFADDHLERTEIINIAIQRSQQLHGHPSYQRTIYVGDKSWDERASHQLGIEFIGVGPSFDKTAKKSGLFIDDYSDSSLLLDYLV